MLNPKVLYLPILEIKGFDMPLELNEKKIKKIILNPLVQLLLVFLLVSSCYGMINSDVISFFLTISVNLRELLIFVLPFLLFSFVAVALSAIPKEGMFFVLGLMLMVCLSNFCNVLISGIAGFFLLSGFQTHNIAETTVVISPFFSINLYRLSTTYALILGVCVGLFNSFRPQKHVSLVINCLHKWVLTFMKRFFIPLLPIFVGGFLLKLFAEGKMTGFVSHNVGIFLLMCGFLVLYLCLWLLVAGRFQFARILEILRNATPAIVTAFSTMSSAAALPMSLEAAEKNTQDKMLADAVMPLTLNFHMVGDTIIVPIMAMLVMVSLNHPLPSVWEFVMFGTFFVLNKFAGGGVPSGTIMVTIPALREYLGFDDSMIAFIIAFYGVVDPIATAGNVAANNFFVVIFQKIRTMIKKSVRHNRKGFATIKTTK
jgi:Na+/H+-dicarboxylate symporter